ncbi:MAG: hypothetical protein ABEJ25_05265 [Candidatus Bipolaricaulia bacterium]
MPSPRGKEKKKDFISRCMSDSKMKKQFSNRDQRLAVCNSYWSQAKKKKQ